MKAYIAMFIMALSILLLLTLPIAYFYYNSDISKYEKAMRDETKLLDPTDDEIKQWEQKNKLLEIEAKKREIYYMEHNMPIPDNNDDAVINHIVAYPEGHNPPKPQIQNLINQAKEKRSELLIGAIILSMLLSTILVSYFAYDEAKMQRRL